MSFDRGNILYRLGRYEAAQKEFEHALTGVPEDAAAHQMLAWCLLSLRKFPQAEIHARESITHQPENSGGYSVMAAICSQRNQLAEAVKFIEQAISLKPMQASYHAQLAGIRLLQRQWSSALSAAETGLGFNPRNSVCRNARSFALIFLGRHDEAGASIDSSLGIDPLNPVTHAGKGLAHLQSGDHVLALEHFQESLRINPNLQLAQLGRKAAVRRRSLIARAIGGPAMRYVFFLNRLSGTRQWSIVCGVALCGAAALLTACIKLRDHDALCGLVMIALTLYGMAVVLTVMGSPVFHRLLRWSAVRGFKPAAVSMVFWVSGCALVGAGVLFTLLLL